jgi:hypothetical protein
MQGISGLIEDLLASQDKLCSMALVSYLHGQFSGTRKLTRTADRIDGQRFLYLPHNFRGYAAIKKMECL